MYYSKYCKKLKLNNRVYGIEALEATVNLFSNVMDEKSKFNNEFFIEVLNEFQKICNKDLINFIKLSKNEDKNVILGVTNFENINKFKNELESRFLQKLINTETNLNKSLDLISEKLGIKTQYSHCPYSGTSLLSALHTEVKKDSNHPLRNIYNERCFGMWGVNYKKILTKNEMELIAKKLQDQNFVTRLAKHSNQTFEHNQQ